MMSGYLTGLLRRSVLLALLLVLAVAIMAVGSAAAEDLPYGSEEYNGSSMNYGGSSDSSANGTADPTSTYSDTTTSSSRKAPDSGSAASSANAVTGVPPDAVSQPHSSVESGQREGALTVGAATDMSGLSTGSGKTRVAWIIGSIICIIAGAGASLWAFVYRRRRMTSGQRIPPTMYS